MGKFKMEINESSDYLEHYGVLGMHWGVRKDGKPQGFQYGKESLYRRRQRKRVEKAEARLEREEERLDRRERRAEEREAKREQMYRDRESKNRALLSDEALDRNIARLEKERRLRDLTDEANHPVRSRMRSDALDIASTVGKRVLIGAGTVAGAALVTYLISQGSEKANPPSIGEVTQDMYRYVAKPKK